MRPRPESKRRKPWWLHVLAIAVGGFACLCAEMFGYSWGGSIAAGSPLVAHDDTVSPWTGTFRLQDVLTGRFWEHGLIDLFYGQFCGCVFPH